MERTGTIAPLDCIIHLAGKAHDTKNTSSAKDYFDINLGLTQKTVDHFLQSSATKFIFFSSVKAVADEVEGEMLTEEAIPAPKTPYGESKLAAERYIQSSMSKVQHSTFKDTTSNLKHGTWNIEPEMEKYGAESGEHGASLPSLNSELRT